MGWKIIEIENAYKLNLFLGNLVMYKDKERITISINDIDVLLINNYKLNMSVQLINELNKNNVLIIYCDKNYLPSSINVPIIGNYNTMKVIANQINWNHKWKAESWKFIIKNKIKNQKDFLNFLKKENEIISKLLELYNEIIEYDVTNREGHASKIYWHSLFGMNFKRHEDDYLNSLLNYGYTILRAYVTRSIIKKGLDPRISIFHRSFHNYFALSSDLMEPFRIIIDYQVWDILHNGDGEANFYLHKEILIKCFNKKILIDGQKQFINNAIDKYIDSFVSQTKIPKINMLYE